MAIYPLRKLPALPCAGLSNDWLEKIDAELKSGADRALLCRRTLCEISHPEFVSNWETAVEDKKLAPATRLALAALDPRNVTLEPEYYAEVDDEKFQRVKPLLWLWYSFDRTILGGQNVELGVRLRRVLAPYIFKKVGENFKAFQFVEFSFGYNMEVGDNVVIHRYVLLDDRGGIRLGNSVSISDFANVYSHTHSIVDQRDVTDAQTIIDDGVRITYHATVLAGVHVHEQAMVGAMAVATKDVRPYHVYVGIPAKSVRVKPNAPPGLDPVTTVRAR
ncbi:MAG TPA: acyltransferase [Gemmatimonadaceae bacterium]|jgi:acetyltransferase-like isoleucine patch superfamily enzyme|nr:acyltransferase [Gemmatimonadaceae bacterium]